MAQTFPKPFYRWRPHPWHGLDAGPEPPRMVHAYIEMTPFDLVKYEIDKSTGYVKVDRPQRSSSQPPTLYGFIPRTFCGKQIGELSPKALRGDGDPLDICVVSERQITRSEIFLVAKIVGGLQVIDRDEADDKMIAVLENDSVWGRAEDLGDLPPALIERLSHYFSTYKLVPGDHSAIEINEVYGCGHALEVVKAAQADYEAMYGQEPNVREARGAS
ncbi:MAG: inorganic pyrophosphatase [Planctomycetota bacterium]|jgi:inorganic pyrophosphatase